MDEPEPKAYQSNLYVLYITLTIVFFLLVLWIIMINLNPEKYKMLDIVNKSELSLPPASYP